MEKILPELTTAEVYSPASRQSQWLSRSALIICFWVGAAVGLSVMAYTSHPGWDFRYYQATIHDLRQGIDPYARGNAEIAEFQRQYVAGLAEDLPLTYHYAPLTLVLLRAVQGLPDWVLGLLCGMTVALGALLELWAGYQMAYKHERRWLALALPAIIFFPGLVIDDVVLSGNVAFILYGLILAAAVPGWKRNQWIWYYLAVLVASLCKLPFLALLAFPVLLARHQWIPSVATACAGMTAFAVQARLWPSLFREYVAGIQMMLDWKREFGYGPAGIVGKALLSRGYSPSHASAIFHAVFAAMLGTILLVLAVRVRTCKIRPETWAPVALVGTLLLGPRLMRYDLAAISVPMLLIAVRALRHVLHQQPDEETARAHTPLFLRLPVLIAMTCFLVPNVIAITGPFSFPGETLILLAVFSLGAWSIFQPQPASVAIAGSAYFLAKKPSRPDISGNASPARSAARGGPRPGRAFR